MVLYSRADSWLGWGEGRTDDVLQSLGRIFQISMHGFGDDFQDADYRKREVCPSRKQIRFRLLRIADDFCFGATLGVGLARANGQAVPAGQATSHAAAMQLGAAQTAQVKMAVIHPNDKDLYRWGPRVSHRRAGSIATPSR